MKTKDIREAKDPDLRASPAAMQRAAELARKTAMQTDAGKQNNPWLCPAASRQTTMLMPEELNRTETYGHIGYNVDGLGVADTGNPLGIASMASDGNLVAVPLGSIHSPSTMIMVGDGVVGANGEYLDDRVYLSRTKVRSYQSNEAFIASGTRRVNKRHGGSLVIGFVDGHVSSLKLSYLFGEKSADALSLWNRDELPHFERSP